jgi:hypothetical protein
MKIQSIKRHHLPLAIEAAKAVLTTSFKMLFAP